MITYFFPGIHTACSCDSHWFYLDVIYSFPKLFQCEMDLLALVPRRNQPNDIPVWFNVSGVVMLSCFFFAGDCLLGEPIYQLCAVESWRQTSPVLQGLLRHDWLTTSPFFPSHLHGEKHGVMRGDKAAEQYLHKKIKTCCLKEWH